MKAIKQMKARIWFENFSLHKNNSEAFGDVSAHQRSSYFYKAEW